MDENWRRRTPPPPAFCSRRRHRQNVVGTGLCLEVLENIGVAAEIASLSNSYNEL